MDNKKLGLLQSCKNTLSINTNIQNQNINKIPRNTTKIVHAKVTVYTTDSKIKACKFTDENYFVISMVSTTYDCIYMYEHLKFRRYFGNFELQYGMGV